MRTPPWLSHLKTWRGLPVPAINLWGKERDCVVDVRYDRNAGGQAVFVDDTGQEVPDFTKQNMQRQRESMVRGLCQVCWRPVPWSRRYLVMSPVSIQRIELGGIPMTVFTEPWLDYRCAQFAVSMCPALIRRTRDQELSVVRVGNRDVRFIASRGWVEGPLEAQTKADPPVMWVKAALRGLDR